MIDYTEKAEELYNVFRDDPWIGRYFLPYSWERILEDRVKHRLQITIDWWCRLVLTAQENAMDYKVLKNEILNDPLVRGYGGMTNAQILTSLVAVNRSRQLESVNSAFIYERLDQTEVQSLDAAATARLDRILGLGNNILVQGAAKTELIAIFGGGSNTIAALAADIVVAISRFEEIGLSGGLSEQIIETAKTGGF